MNICYNSKVKVHFSVLKAPWLVHRHSASARTKFDSCLRGPLPTLCISCPTKRIKKLLKIYLKKSLQSTVFRDLQIFFDMKAYV